MDTGKDQLIGHVRAAIQAENAGGPGGTPDAAKAAGGILAADFCITRNNGTEQNREGYLDWIRKTDRPSVVRALKDPYLVSEAKTRVVRSIVEVGGTRYRNMHVFERQQNGSWLCIVWQVTNLDQDSFPPQWSPLSHKHTHNSIKSFVHLIFFLYDKRVDYKEILPYLSDNDLEMNFPDYKPIRGHSDFIEWYNGVKINDVDLAWNTHAIRGLQVDLGSNGKYHVEMDVLWEAMATNGASLSLRTHQCWRVIDGNGDWPKIEWHTATPI